MEPLLYISLVLMTSMHLYIDRSDCLQYDIPEKLCNDTISSVSIGDLIPGFDVPEIAFVVNHNSLWYFPMKTNAIERNWNQILTPKGMDTPVTFHRTYFEDFNECQTKAKRSQFIVLALINNTLMYEIFDVENNSFVFFDKFQNLNKLYVLRDSAINWNQKIDQVMTWSQYIIVFQDKKYFVVKLEQNACDQDLNKTVKSFGPFNIEEIYSSGDKPDSIKDAILYENKDKVLELYLFQNDEYFEYRKTTIDETSGILKAGQLNHRNKTAKGFFICKSVAPITLPNNISDNNSSDTTTQSSPEAPPNVSPDSSNSNSISTPDNRNQGLETTVINPNDSTTSKSSKRKFPFIVIIILVISIIIAIIICIFCCICAKNKNKSDEHKESAKDLNKSQLKDKSNENKDKKKKVQKPKTLPSPPSPPPPHKEEEEEKDENEDKNEDKEEKEEEPKPKSVEV